MSNAYVTKCLFDSFPGAQEQKMSTWCQVPLSFWKYIAGGLESPIEPPEKVVLWIDLLSVCHHITFQPPSLIFQNGKWTNIWISTRFFDEWWFASRMCSWMVYLTKVWPRVWNWKLFCQGKLHAWNLAWFSTHYLRGVIYGQADVGVPLTASAHWISSEDWAPSDSELNHIILWRHLARWLCLTTITT